ncbi:MAG TPA: hypothetical protein VD908_12405 [Cytophagales bacterium]|nr:hypothetical protein [Cytophagales bacterium]
MKKYFICLLFFSISIALFGQRKNKESKQRAATANDFTSTEIKVDSIEKDIFTPDIVFQEIKKKKPKKNVFYGLKTKKHFTRIGGAGNQVIELFHYLKEYREPNPYVQDIYWYSKKEKRIKKSTIIDKPNALILHGPYLKIVRGDTVEEGNYYIGTKHGRWNTYKKGFILSDKKNFHKGWPRDAEITYYDTDKKKIKEVIPREYGMVHGDYYSFYDNGLLMEEGKYKYGVKIGKWIEYHKLRRKRKTETQYAKDPYDKDFEPYLLKEYDQRGKVLYDYKKDKNTVSTKD